MAKSLLSLSLLANLCVAHAIDRRWPFNACEVSYDSDLMLINVRFCDQNAPRKYQHRSEYACAYDNSGWSDGSEIEIHLDHHIQSWSLDQVRDLLDKTITNPWSIEGASRMVMAGEDVFRIVED